MSRWLDLVMEFLPLMEAFGCAKVCQVWLETQKCLDAKVFLHQLRMVCAGDINILNLHRQGCRQLILDWHECLRNASLQVAYVSYDQHLIYVEPNTTLAKPPQGSDPFPVDTDAPSYHCLIKAFTMDTLWWECLDQELFRWPRESSDAEAGEVSHHCEAVPGYTGDVSAPKLPDDVLAIMALNAAWFHYSFWTRQLQAILLLRDGRFLLIRTSEMQSTVDTQANAQVYRCFVADSLWSIVMFAQDPKSREVLRTRVPARFTVNHLSQPKKNPLDERVAHVKLPRVEPSSDVELIQNPGFEQIFGSFRSADGLPGEGSLFSSAELVQEEARRRLKPGDLCRVERAGDNYIWQSCLCDGWGMPDGPLPPDVEIARLEQASCQDRRFLSFSKGCHLGLRREVSYSAVITYVHGSTVDVQYTNPSEWADGASGFTNSLGSSLKEPPMEADVKKTRVTVLPDSKWYWNFWQTWERGELPRTSSVGDFLFPPHLESEPKHLKLADAFADTERGHIFRVNLLAEEKERLQEDCHTVIDRLVRDVESSTEILRPPGWLWPRQNEMALAKRLFLKLLRTPFWTTWIERGGESPSKVTTLFGKKKFVRLVLR